jgi:hypothetical protein
MALIFVLLGVSFAQESPAVGRDAASPRPVLDVLSGARVSGSLEYWGRCDLQQFPDFPRFNTPLQIEGSPVQTLIELFADDPKMRVTEEVDGWTELFG